MSLEVEGRNTEEEGRERDRTVGVPNLKINMFFDDKEPIEVLSHPFTLSHRHTQIGKHKHTSKTGFLVNLKSVVLHL